MPSSPPFPVGLNAVAILYAIFSWSTERADCREARRKFALMTKMAFTNELYEIIRPANRGMTDMDYLQFLTMRNLDREDNKLFGTCSFALRSAQASLNDPTDEEELSEKFFEHLYGIVARGLDDDKDVEDLAEQAQD